MIQIIKNQKNSGKLKRQERKILQLSTIQKMKKENMCQLQTIISEVVMKLNGPQRNENKNKRDCNDF